MLQVSCGGLVPDILRIYSCYKLCKRCLKAEQSRLEEMWLLYTLTRLHESHLCSDQLAIRQLAITLEQLNHAFTE